MKRILMTTLMISCSLSASSYLVTKYLPYLCTKPNLDQPQRLDFIRTLFAKLKEKTTDHLPLTLRNHIQEVYLDNAWISLFIVLYIMMTGKRDSTPELFFIGFTCVSGLSFVAKKVVFGF